MRSVRLLDYLTELQSSVGLPIHHDCFAAPNVDGKAPGVPGVTWFNFLQPNKSPNQPPALQQIMLDTTMSEYQRSEVALGEMAIKANSLTTVAKTRPVVLRIDNIPDNFDEIELFKLFEVRSWKLITFCRFKNQNQNH